MLENPTEWTDARVAGEKAVLNELEKQAAELYACLVIHYDNVGDLKASLEKMHIKMQERIAECKSHLASYWQLCKGGA